jgi:hypothetical protein
MLRARHGWNWGQVRRQLTATRRWQITVNWVEYLGIEGVTVSRYAYRGNKSPPHGHPRTPPDDRHRGERVAERSARRVRRAAWETDREQPRRRAPGRLTKPVPRRARPGRPAG